MVNPVRNLKKLTLSPIPMSHRDCNTPDVAEISNGVKAGIIGVTGYAGEELLRILLKHPQVKITYLSAKLENYPQKIKEIFPWYEPLTDSYPGVQSDLECEELNLEKVKNICDLVFLALPHSVSLEIVAELFNAGKRVIDLSADYRLNNPKVYEKWYKKKHTHPDLLKKAVYGLPEIYREKIKQVRGTRHEEACLIANPGCYPTGAILACAPLVRNNFVKETIIVDAKSGISGGGREFVQFYYPENKDNFKAYNIGVHRHQPEIEQELSKLQQRAKSKNLSTEALAKGGQRVKVTFVPHLLPLERGILSTIYLTLKKTKNGKRLTENRIRDIYSKFYADEPFMRILPEGKFPELKNVVHTNYCELNLKLDKSSGQVIVISAIDNLVKGASGQAVQNMNLVCGFNETKGLI